MKNFLIVGTQRTGSSALAEMLGLHPEITCGWESTRSVPFFRKIAVTQEVFSGNFVNLRKEEKEYVSALHNSNKTALGFRRLFNSSDKWTLHPRYAPALIKDRLESHIHWLTNKRPDVSIIHMVRTDNLAWLKSMGLASRPGYTSVKSIRKMRKFIGTQTQRKKEFVQKSGSAADYRRSQQVIRTCASNMKTFDRTMIAH